jgi:electron transfer flavoprotein alpha subunit
MRKPRYFSKLKKNLMSVLVFIDHSEGQVKKASLEALSYGAALAAQLGVAAEGILLGTIASDPAAGMG